MVATINTKYGVFEVSDNGNGGSVLFMNGKKICEFPKIEWWNSDRLISALDEHDEVVRERIKASSTSVEITKDNVLAALDALITFFGNDQKGFYSSRLKQCYNKYLSVK